MTNDVYTRRVCVCVYAAGDLSLISIASTSIDSGANSRYIRVRCRGTTTTRREKGCLFRALVKSVRVFVVLETRVEYWCFVWE